MTKSDSDRDRKILAPLCMGCGHLGKPHSITRVRGEKRIQYMCDLHGISVGESSVCCKDGTNVDAFFRAMYPGSPLNVQRSAEGWDDY